MDQLAIEVGSAGGNRLPSFLVSASELARRLAFPEGSRCACKNVDDSLIFVRALIEDALARYGGAGGEVPFTIYAVESSDHKIVCHTRTASARRSLSWLMMSLGWRIGCLSMLSWLGMGTSIWAIASTGLC